MKTLHTIRLIAIILAIIYFSLQTINAQTNILCGTDIMSQKLMDAHPELIDSFNHYQAYTQNWIKNYEAKNTTKGPHRVGVNAPTKYIIPIVFHILHQNGPENISDAQVMDEIRILNEDWGHYNPDTGYAVTSHFKSIEGNPQVEFRLAQIDPNGNCTNGIDRIYTPYTNNADNLTKLNPWDRTKYVNVWVCKELNSNACTGCTVLGYAYYPWEVTSTPWIDGVLIANYCIGSIGTALTNGGLGGIPGEFQRTLSHEIGHVMNLVHPFGSTNSPGVTGTSGGPPTISATIQCGSCGVPDVPITKGYFSYCPTGIGNDMGQKSGIVYKDTMYAAICDTVGRDTVSTNPLQVNYHILLENFQNFMDYSECAMMFTVGQQEAIWAALNSPISGRNNLWDTANLFATGVMTKATHVDSASTCVPIADFYGNPCYVCQGSSVDFTDISWNAAVTNWLWAFTGATISSSTKQNPVVTFNSPYSQTVSLTVSNSAGGNTLTQYGYVYVSPPWTTYFGTFSEGFENPAEVSENWLFHSKFNDGTNWQYTNTAAATGTGSLLLNSYAPVIISNNPPGEIASLGDGALAIWDAITPSVNMQTASAMSLSFDYSCATLADYPKDITDSLKIGYSLNCGATWTSIKNLVGSVLTNVGNYRASFTPTSASEWQSISLPLSSSLNGKTNVRFRFEYVSSAFSNNFYIDNINLSGTVGINEFSATNYSFNIYPNPSCGYGEISYYLTGTHVIRLVVKDIVGREIETLLNQTEPDGQHSINFNAGLSDGIYFVSLISDGNLISTRKLIIAR